MRRKWTAMITAEAVLLSFFSSGAMAGRARVKKKPQDAGTASSSAAQSPKPGQSPATSGSASVAPPATASTHTNGTAQSPQPSAAQSNTAQSGEQEEMIEIERQTPFGMMKYRVPKRAYEEAQKNAAQGQSQPSPGQAPMPMVPGMRPGMPVVVPPATPQAPANVPAAVQQPPAAPAQANPPIPQAPPATTPTPENATVPIALHLENAQLSQVIGIIASELKMNYVVDPTVKGLVNINTMGEVKREDLFPLLQMILRINGATAVQTGNFFRVVPLKDVQRLPIDPMFDPQASSLPLDDRMVMNIIPLKYVSAADMTKILTPFLSEGGHLFSQDAGNILILTDSSRSMKRLLELVAMFDSEAFTNKRARLFQIKNSQAAKVAAELGQIFSAYGLSGGSGAVRFVPIERINSILAVSANASVYSEVERWLEVLDKPQQESGLKTFVYRVENAKASDLAGVLGPLLGATVTITQSQQQRQQAAAAAATGTMQPGPAPQAPPATSPFSGSASGTTTLQGTSDIRIVADSINNQLIIQATAQEYEQILQTIKEMDVLPRQVMIEARVYEVDLTGSLSAGVSAFLQNPDPSFQRKLLGSFAGSNGGAPALSASLGSLVGKTRELELFLNAAESRGQARVISAPSILASDNKPASIDVGSSIPILTSQAVVGGAQVQGNSLFTNTIQNVDTGVLLTITPQINPSGLVTLQIDQEVSAPQGTTGPIASPTIQKRTVQTQAVVENGQTIAIGGIIQENRSLNKNRIPLLGDIPYLGALFGSTSLSTQRTELIILVTPTVIRTVTEAQEATNELRNKLRDLRQILEDDEEKQNELRKKNEERSKKKTEAAPAPATSVQPED